MANTDTFGNNNIDSNNVFGNSLIDEATLVNPLTNSPSSLGININNKSSENFDQFAPLNQPEGTDTESDTSTLTSLEQPTVFNQPTLPVVNKRKNTENSENSDQLTGNQENLPLLASAPSDPLTGSAISGLNVSTFTATIPNYAIRTEGTVRFNGGGDLDGNPLNLADDALIYAAQGFTINGNIMLPVQRDCCQCSEMSQET